MAKLNEAWVLKYSIFRQELKVLALNCDSKEDFLDLPVVEVSYPQGKTGPRYSSFAFVYPVINSNDNKLSICPVYENCIIQLLSRQEKLRLWNYYKLDVHYYGKEKN